MFLCPTIKLKRTATEELLGPCKLNFDHGWITLLKNKKVKDQKQQEA
jgi:hypothetical protein